MAVQVEQLGRAFSAETEHQFTVWTLATPDPLEQVLEPGLFRPTARDPPPAGGGDADRGAARRPGSGDLGEAAGAARYACRGDGPGDPGRAGRGAAGSRRHGGTGGAGRTARSLLELEAADTRAWAQPCRGMPTGPTARSPGQQEPRR